jgi:hypothetical protein
MYKCPECKKRCHFPGLDCQCKPVSASHCSAASSEATPEPAAVQDGNNAVGIAAVQAVCDDIVCEFEQRLKHERGYYGAKLDDIMQVLQDVMQRTQRASMEKDAHNAG